MNNLLTQPSICIPRTLANVTWYQVKEVFEQLLGKGTVERVDLVKSKSNDHRPFCRIFIHLRFWPDNKAGQDLKKRLLDGDTVVIMYDKPWFWKCVASNCPKPDNNRPKIAPYIQPGEILPQDTIINDIESEDDKATEPVLVTSDC